MSDTVIKVENLGKKYIIGHQGKRGYRTFREQMMQHLHNFYSRTKKVLSGQQILEGDEMEEFWALKDVNFEIRQGDRVGIIGRNGAGKSTLLKILSRITEPSTGRVSIKGRVASLLEVGTGFHQELSGRENIFLNGAILGMSRSEIKRKFDEIIEFSGVEIFLDTPVKRYSSGMYVRLAFAIAAHLEPEILIIDEVLAVGDAEFQKKCLGKMQEVSHNEGRTVIFVSHNMQAVQALCNRGIVFKKGKLIFNGSANDSITEYIRGFTDNVGAGYKGTGIIRSVNIISTNGNIEYNSSLRIVVEFFSDVSITNLVLGVVIKDFFDIPVIGINNRHYSNSKLNNSPVQKGNIAVVFNHLRLLPGIYNMDVFLGDSTTDIAVVENAISFTVIETPITNTATQLEYKLNKVFMKEVNWELTLK